MIVLSLVLVAVVAWHLWSEREWRSERQRLVNAIVARNAHELVGLDLSSSSKPRKPKDRDPVPEQVGA